MNAQGTFFYWLIFVIESYEKYKDNLVFMLSLVTKNHPAHLVNDLQCQANSDSGHNKKTFASHMSIGSLD